MINKLVSIASAVLLVFAMAFTGVAAHGQAVSVNGGSIQGTITDETGAVVPGAQIDILGVDTGSKQTLKTDSAGFFSVGPLNPGNYKITIAMPGFENTVVTTVVKTGTATSGNYKLVVGKSTETVEVDAGALQVQTEQIAVQDVITADQIKTLPINGRNFLDLAQLEPGVVLQSGESFDPTKAGYSAISTQGVSGRTTRILLDGQDITDETVGTTILNVPTGAVNEFAMSRSTQDVSGEITSTGQVLVATNSGTNSFHGQAFYNFQDYRAGFANGPNGTVAPFQRNQVGGAVGGPLWKDKLFFFANYEHIKQVSQVSSGISSSIFPDIYAAHPNIGTPFKETYATGRIDWNGPLHGHYFFRGAYNANGATSNFGFAYQLYSNRDNTPAWAGGADFVSNGGKMTHSFRGSYEKFHNFLADATAGNTSIYQGVPGLSLRYASGTTTVFASGPNIEAPQATFQSDKQFRYDGAWTKGAHNIRWGYAQNRLLGGGYASFYGFAPYVSITGAAFKPGTGTASGTGSVFPHCNNDGVSAPCPNDPTRGYAPTRVRLGNGQGFATEHTGFGLPGGGIYTWRFAGYIADSWKATPDLTISAGLRYQVDTNRANQDLGVIPCSDIVTANATVAGYTPPCTGSSPLLDQFSPGFGARVNQPYNNFGPQIGFAFSPGNHKMVVHAGIGIYYDSNVFNNLTNSRSVRLKQGLLFGFQAICGSNGTTVNMPNASGGITPVTTTPDGESIGQVCQQPLSKSATQLIALRKQYTTAVSAAGASVNSSYVGQSLSIAQSSATPGPNYKNPYSLQYSFGLQRELSKGMVVTADYIHSSTLRLGTQIDVNHVGAARTLNVANAQAAITATTSSYAGCTGGASAAAINCAIGKGATMSTFAGNGLDSGTTFNSGAPGAFSSAGRSAAFPGLNPNVGNGFFILPVGRSAFDALQLVLKQQKAHPFAWVDHTDLQVAYQLSMNQSSSNPQNDGDSFFTSAPWDQDSVSRYMGRNNLDHMNQFTMGGSMLFKYGPRLSLIGHFFSAPATSMQLDNTGGGAGQIYLTDISGDGLSGDIAPGTNPGDYMHRYRGSSLNQYITTFNQTNAGQVTPAGQALINAGLFTQAQLTAMGAVMQKIAPAPAIGAIQNSMYSNLDASLSYAFHFHRLVPAAPESLSIEPAVSFYNIMNFSNFTAGKPGGFLTNAGTDQFINGSNNSTVQGQYRTQRETGTFDQGGPRSTEFSLKVNF
jgi:hypothetical protein